MTDPVAIDLSAGTSSVIQLDVQDTSIDLSVAAGSSISMDLAASPINVGLELTTIDLSLEVQGPQGAPGVSGGGSISAEQPSGTIDGSNRVFTMSQVPIAASVLVFVNGLLQVVGCTVSGATITFDSDAAPMAGDSLFVHYQHL